MTWSKLIRLFLRHAASASAVLLAILALAERLVPGSVMLYFNFLWLVPVTLILIIFSFLFPPMSDCLFCQIVAKEIPSTPVFEDENVYAFLDIKPVNPGHVLVVPKKHFNGLLDADPETVKNWMAIVQRVAKAVKEGMGAEGFNLELNDGAVAGQLVNHLHMHIVPRKSDDNLKHWPGTAYATAEEAGVVAEKIRKGL